MKQVGPIRMSDHRPTLFDCLCEWDHGDNCVTALQSWLTANHTDNMETKPDAIQTMMRLSTVRNRSKASQDHTKTSQDRVKVSNNDALQTEKEKDVTEKEVQVFFHFFFNTSFSVKKKHFSCVPLVSSSRKCFLQHLRKLHVLTYTHEEWDYEVLRGWSLKVLFCQWTMTLNSGHDVGEESLFLLKYSIFSINLQKKKALGGVPSHVDGEDGKSV